MKQSCLLLFLSLLMLMAEAQKSSFILEGRIEGLSAGKVFLAAYYGEKSTIVDSVVSDKAGNLRFTLSDRNPAGMYVLRFPGKKSLELIFNHEDIVFTTQMENLYDSLVIRSSEENRVYYGFMKSKKRFNRMFELLNPLVDYFPRDDTFYDAARGKYISIQNELGVLAERTINDYPGSFAARLIALQKPPFLDPELAEQERFEYLRDHFFDDKKFNDMDLLRTNAYPALAIEYMSLFGNSNYSQDELEEELKKAVDEILYRSVDNAIVYDFIVEYLVGGFQKYHFDKVLDHIAQSYSHEQCENEDRKSDLATRLEKYAELAEGKRAPDIVIKDREGKQVRLSEIAEDYTLVLFWASWCTHCGETLPEIHELYLNQKGKKYEILAVSLDKERSEWEDAIAQNGYQWIDACDLKGWNSEAAVDYNVYATPTMFLLDRSLTILSKPVTLQGLKKALGEFGLL